FYFRTHESHRVGSRIAQISPLSLNLYLSFFLRFSLRMIFRMRKLSGVTSKYSPCAMYSIYCSRERSMGGASLTLSSEPDARILVSFFVLVTLTTRSFSRVCSPTI